MDRIRALTRVKTSSDWGFRKHWRSATYHIGDIYQDDIQGQYREEWKLDTHGPYLQFLKDISPEWPNLRLLADFMEVGTDPLRWRNFHGNDKGNAYTYPDDPDARQTAQSERVNRTQVRQLEYLADETVRCAGSYNTPLELGRALETLDRNRARGGSAGSHVQFKLFVVEDLSREVIEQLGYHFDIDPDFFRAHIFDYAWFNIRDPFWDPPSLYVDMERRDWFQIRFCRVRYFSSTASFNKGQDAANKFNVGRKLYEDENRAFWDTNPPAKAVKRPNRSKPQSEATEEKSAHASGPLLTGLTGSFWSRYSVPDEEAAAKNRSNMRSTAGLDVAVESKSSKEGSINGKVGLMRTKATCWTRKGVNGECDVGVLLLDPTIEEGFPLWRGHRNWQPKPSATSKPSPSPSRPPKERSFFEDFVRWAEKPTSVLGNLEVDPCDMRHVPILALLRLVCCEWLNLSEYIKARLAQVDWEVTHPEAFLSQRPIDTILNKLHTWRHLVPLYREMLTETKSRLPQFLGSGKQPGPPRPTPLDTYRQEIGLVLEQMEEYEKRIDRLTTVVTSSISIADSRRVERLTVLATLFVPLNLVGTLFSMTGDVGELRWTFAYWAAASASLLLVQLAWTLYTASRPFYRRE